MFGNRSLDGRLCFFLHARLWSLMEIVACDTTVWLLVLLYFFPVIGVRVPTLVPSGLLT